MIKLSLLISLILLCVGMSTLGQSKMPPSILWQKSLGGSKSDRAFTVIKTLDQGMLAIGESFSNDGDVTGHHGSTDSSDAWLVKLDINGNILWQKSYGGSRNDRLTDGIALSDGSFILTGSSESDNGDVSGLHAIVSGNYVANPDMWVLKIDAFGNVLWSKLYGGSLTEDGISIQHHPSGGFIVAGNAASTDFDLTSTKGYDDIWLVKLDASGSMEWQKTYGGTHRDYTTSLAIASNGDMLISGYTRRRPDFVPSPPCQAIYAYYSATYLRVTAQGDPIWLKGASLPCGNPGTSTISFSIMETPNGNILYLGGKFSSSLEEFPRLLVSRLNSSTGEIENSASGDQFFYQLANELVPAPRRSHMFEDSSVLTVGSRMSDSQNKDAFLTHLDTRNANSFGEYFRKLLTGWGNLSANGLAAFNENHFVMAGFSNATTGAGVGNHGSFDFLIATLRNGNFIKGTVFYDQNSNGTKDANESFVNGVSVSSQKGNVTAGSVTSTPAFVIQVDTGAFQTSVVSPNPYYNAVPATKSSVFAGYGLTDSFSFALQPIPGKKDYEVSIWSGTPARPGFEMNYGIKVSNPGTDTLQSKTVRLIKDSRTQFVSASPAPISQVGDTILWTISNLLPTASEQISLTLKLAPPPIVNSGDSIVNRVNIDTTGDQQKNNNTAKIRQIVTNSFDPNDKLEINGGILYKKEYESGLPLQYTIRFQNTGTDTAFTVVIKDTLSVRFDSSSIEMVGASHPYQLQIKNGRFCTWTFNNIMLPDSNVNEPLSNGYITFKIKPKSGFIIGDTLKNSASIYFDFNPPVKTNVHQTIITPIPVPQPNVSGLLATYCSTAGTEKGKINNLPAADSDISVNVLLDGTNITVDADSTFSFPVYALATGPHTITVAFLTDGGGKTVTHNFEVTTAVAPDVNVSASVTNITSLATPVLVTASNAAGGGSAPKYTFAKDRAFANILQAEGNSNTLSVDPALLTIGDNWIFVKMKSDFACVATDIATDSIKLVRDMSTGITDPDNPSRVIKLYPNPSDKQLFVSGLSVAKKYTLSVSNLNGQLIQQVRVANRNIADIMLHQRKAGIYMLTIYDETKQRLLGTLKIIKR